MSSEPSSSGRRSRTPSSDIEPELIAAAEAVLLRDGPAGVTVRAVAAQAGIAPMGVYNHLGGKDGLINALLIRGFDRLRAALTSVEEPGPLDRLRGGCLRYRGFAQDNRPYYSLMFEGGIIPHDFKSLEVAEHATAAFEALVHAVEYAAAAGAVVASDPHEAAQQIWSTVHGAVALELQGLVLTPDPAATYQATVDTVLRGLAP